MADSLIATPGPSPSPSPELHATPAPQAPQGPAVPMDVVLPKEPKPDEHGMVNLGHLHVAAAIYGQFREAMIYDSKNPDTVGVVERLMEGPRNTTVNQSPDRSAATNTAALNGDAAIRWDPNPMLIDGQGGRHSAAIIVGHELVHADRYTHNDEKFFNDRDSIKGGPGFKNHEEQTVVETWEAKTSRLCGEAVRHVCTSGQFFPNRGVTSTELPLHQTRDGHTSEVKNGYSQTGKITDISEVSVDQETRKGQAVSYPRTELEAAAYPATLRAGENLSVSMSANVLAAREIPTHGAPDVGLAR